LFRTKHIVIFYANLINSYEISIFVEIKNKKEFMKNKIEAVKAFHTAFKIGHRETPKGEEYLEAANKNDLVEVADALGDMLYILCGTIIEHGMQYKIEEVFEEIQRSNMSKLGGDGEPIYREDGKVLKGPNYFKPNIKAILDK